MSRTRKSYEPGHQRKFLVVIDDTPECDRAVYYGSRRAARTNAKLIMVTVIPVGEVNQQWLGVGDLMRAEAHEEAEKRLDHFALRAHKPHRHRSRAHRARGQQGRRGAES